MTDRKRPWWMLHWPSWLAFVVFGAAFVTLNFSPHTDRGDHDARLGMRRNTISGWPFAMLRVTNDHGGGMNPNARTVADWDLSRVVGNSLTAVTLLLLPLGSIETFCRRYRVAVSLRVLLATLSVFCGALVTFHLISSRTFGSGARPDSALEMVAGAVIAVAIGLASSAVLDFVGWLFSRPSKREV